MSHFAVLVAGDNPEEQLAPYSESNENYKSFVDKTEEVLDKWEIGSIKEFFCESLSSWGMKITKEIFDDLSTMSIEDEIIYNVKNLDPMQYFKLDKKYRGYYELKNGSRCQGEQWFQVVMILLTSHPDKDICFTEKIIIKKIAAPKTISMKEKYQTFEQYLNDYYGYEEKDGRYGYNSNVEAKWDWYQLGGRWSGILKLKEGKKGVKGENSVLFDNERGIDQALKGDIDFESIRKEAADHAKGRYEKAMEIIGGYPENLSWDDVMESFSNIDMAKEWYWDQPRCKVWKEKEKSYGKDWPFGWSDSPDDYLIPYDEYIQNSRDSAFITFAVLKDGRWHEKGKMGVL